MIFLHGYNANLGDTHDWLARLLNARNIACAGIEHWASARSTHAHVPRPHSVERTLRRRLGCHGLLGYIPSFQRLVEDAVSFAEAVKSGEYDVGCGVTPPPIFLLGESMGGACALEASRVAPPGLIDGLVLLAPMCGLSTGMVPSLWKVLLGQALVTLLPALPAFILRDTTSETFRDPEKVPEVRADPLRLHTRTRLRTAFTLRDAAAAIGARAHEYTSPLLIFHGTSDAVCPLSASRALISASRSRDKTLLVLENAWHALWAEPLDTRKRMVEDLVGWIAARAHGVTPFSPTHALALSPTVAAAGGDAGLHLERPDGVGPFRDAGSVWWTCGSEEGSPEEGGR